ncbi:hypothetical protein E1B28_009459 [Marasmius oreades]|uniref:Uncharacterized protein n=1 Tax=Marasmius oreades TaxID=181124 RepID=A0A9P7RV40_9AGAR|nr:uncharacterized protein E1B28_009459 [Marasmius oreades]KAG7090339.1 hypothetical protein E1B28_009459 [Marasmius oreades]
MSSDQTITICWLSLDQCIYDVVDSSLVAPVVSLVLYGKSLDTTALDDIPNRINYLGGYLMLFGACICVLRRKPDSQRRNWVVILALFLVASCGLGFNVAAFFTKAKFHLVHGTTPVTVSREGEIFSPTTAQLGDDKFVALYNTGQSALATRNSNLYYIGQYPDGWNFTMEMFPDLERKTPNGTPTALLLRGKQCHRNRQCRVVTQTSGT